MRNPISVASLGTRRMAVVHPAARAKLRDRNTRAWRLRVGPCGRNSFEAQLERSLDALRHGACPLRCGSRRLDAAHARERKSEVKPS